MKIIIPENKPNSSNDHSLVYLNETMRHAMQGHTGLVGYGGEFSQNVVHWSREMENLFIILGL